MTELDYTDTRRISCPNCRFMTREQRSLGQASRKCPDCGTEWFQ